MNINPPCVSRQDRKTGRTRYLRFYILVDSNVLVKFCMKCMYPLITWYTGRMHVTFVCKTLTPRPVGSGQCAFRPRYKTSRINYWWECNYGMLNGCPCLICWSMNTPRFTRYVFYSMNKTCTWRIIYHHHYSNSSFMVRPGLRICKTWYHW